MSFISAILLVLLLLWPAMSFLPQLQTFITRTLGFDDPSGSSSPSNMSRSSSDVSGGPPHPSEPSPMDVVVVKMMLQQGLRLPPEVILSILDSAEYWPHTTAIMDRPLTTVSGRDSEDSFVVRSRPLGLIRKTHYDDRFYSFTPVSPEPLSDDAEYPLSQLQDWIGGPTKTLQHPCRKIVFTITSHDQGWAHNARHDRGSYRGSWTWFEAGLERFDKNASHPKDSSEKDPEATGPHDPGSKEAGAGAEAEVGQSSSDITTHPDTEQLPNPYLPVYSLRPIHPTLEPDRPALHYDLLPSPQLTIQHNKTATREPTTHKVVWSWNDDAYTRTAEQLKEVGRGGETGSGDFVRNLKLGDVVTVWAKSRFGGWANHVESVKVHVYWAL